MSVHQELDEALRRLEATMKASNLWQMSQPSAEAFDSQQPFCVDTMALPQWLRFVFIARLDALVEARGPLPTSCDVAPAADMYLKQSDARPSERLLLVKAIEEVDRVITENE
ncbi:YqcC family protein [Litchfieldella xinjiangensis]|uniref:YqcC family protein n=1 Tax=Litchfieldella xinjiangensis TaxID=1166948 RepID=UPI0005B92864|nr:YqcC family protein [Halomonas xinjiangensis]